MPDQFVNPSPNTPLKHVLAFDFPAHKDLYRAKNCLANINIDAPAIEQMYGLLGTPGREQGHPCIREFALGEQVPVEAEDPNVFPYQDQVVDIERGIEINFTGRLSGSFAKYLANDKFYSRVRMFAHPLAPAEGNPVEIYDKTVSLDPAAEGPNVWFWLGPAKLELLYTAHARINAVSYLKSEQIYKLIAKWEFYEKDGKKLNRMPISGFDEAVTFEVIGKAITL
jgi:hypothetical protein